MGFAKTILANDYPSPLDQLLREIEILTQDKESLKALRKMIELEEALRSSSLSSVEKSSYFLKVNSLPLDLAKLEVELDTGDFALGLAYEYTATNFYLRGDFESAKTNYHKALKVLLIHGHEYRVYRWLGLIYCMLEDIDAGLEYFNQAIATAKTYFGEGSAKGHAFLFALHANVLSVYSNSYDFKKAQEHATEALTYAEALHDPNFLLTAHLNQAHILVNTFKADKAIAVLNAAEYLLTENTKEAINYYNLLGIAYFKKEQYKKAIAAFEKSNGMIPSQSVHLANRRLNTGGIAEAQILLEDYEDALANFNTVISFYQDYTDIFNSSLADAFHGRAKVNLALGKLEAARQDIAKSLTYQGEYKTWKISHYSNLGGVYAAQFQKTKNPLYIDSLKQSIQENDRLIQKLYIEHRYFEDEVRLHSYVHDAYAKNLAYLYLSYSVDTASVSLAEVFRYFEGLKSYSLKEILKTDEAVRIGQVPEEILTQERAYKYQLSRIKKQLFKQEQTGKDSLKIRTYQKELSQTKDAYYLFLEELEIAYPNYYRYQYAHTQVSLPELQASLSSNEAIIEYFESHHDIFTLVIESENVRFYKQPKYNEWEEILHRFHKSLSNITYISHPDSTEEVFETYVFTARYLYKKLFQKVQDQLSEEIRYVKVVPDDHLNFIPFGLLLSGKGDNPSSYKNLPYLLRDFTLSYTSSASDYIRVKKQASKSTTSSYLGIAPAYQSDYSDSLDREIDKLSKQLKKEAILVRNNLQDLPAARASIQKISELYDGQTLTNHAANKQAFLAQAQGANILHFAMHGILNLDEPLFSHLVFSDTFPDYQLYIEEIFNLELSADLAVLSACNTGSGKMLNGDGVQSISRAFAFAGVSATTMSLWSVPDIQTSQIDLAFFKELKAGKRIDDALRNAQLAYLADAPKQRSHPFYWAGFVPSGDMEMRPLSNNYNNVFYILLMGGILFVGFWFLRSSGKTQYLEDN